MKQILAGLFLSLAIGAPLADTGSVTEYEATRFWEGMYDFVNTDGYAKVHDDGPYTAIKAISLVAGACPLECNVDENGHIEESLYFSPVPPCHLCRSINVTLDSVSWTTDGGIYTMADGSEVHIVRRGSEETGDPSLLIGIDSELWMFREVPDNDPEVASN